MSCPFWWITHEFHLFPQLTETLPATKCQDFCVNSFIVQHVFSWRLINSYRCRLECELQSRCCHPSIKIINFAWKQNQFTITHLYFTFVLLYWSVYGGKKCIRSLLMLDLLYDYRIGRDRRINSSVSNLSSRKNIDLVFIKWFDWHYILHEVPMRLIV